MYGWNCRYHTASHHTLPSMHSCGRSFAARSAGDEDVPVLGDVLTGGHPLNQISVELAPGGIVDVTDERI